jgi:UDP-N-acetylmuramoyl-L-alanyl-D-glutamate--2,6-diaminopimelate ligase
MPELSIDRLAGLLEARGLLAGRGGSGDSACAASGVCHDPAPLQAGFLYVDLYGNDERARTRMREAVQLGVCAVVTAGDPRGPLGVPVLRVRHARRALSLASAALYGFPADKLTLIGITGSNGKTTTACMLARALVLGGVPCGLISSSAIRIGGEVRVAEFLTTPDAPDLHRMLAGMVDAGDTHAVVEVSSHALAHGRVDDLPFRMAVMTNLTEDHLDFHPTMQHYEDTKALLFERLPADGLSIVNADDPAAVRIGSRTRARTRRVGSGPGADWKVGGDGLSVFRGEEPGPPGVVVPLDGPNTRAHNRTNAALAAAAALAGGVAPEGLGRVFAEYPGIRRRLQCVYEGRFRVMDDLGTSPGHYGAVLKWMETERARYRHLHVLTNIRGNRGLEMNRLRAEILARELPRHGLKHLWVSGCEEDSRLEARGTPEEKQAFLSGLKSGGLRYHWRSTNREALAGLLRRVRRGDLVFLLGGWGLEHADAELVERLRRRRRWVRGGPEWYGETDPLAVCRNLFRASVRPAGVC